MIHLDNLFNTWPSLLFGGLIGFISSRLLKGLEFAREHRGVREQMLALLCRIEESAKRASNSSDVDSIAVTCAILRERTYSGEYATGLLGTRAINVLYDDFAAIDSLAQDAKREVRRDLGRALDLVMKLGERAAVTRYRLGDSRSIRIIRNPRDAVRPLDFVIYAVNIATMAAFGAIIAAVFLTSLLQYVGAPPIESFVASFVISFVLLTLGFVRNGSKAFTAKFISERIQGRRVIMRVVVTVVAYFGVAFTAIGAFESFLAIAYRPFFDEFWSIKAVMTQAVMFAFVGCALVALLVMSIRYMHALREEERVVAMAGRDGVCREAPRSIHFGDKSLCGCSPAECISKRLAL